MKLLHVELNPIAYEIEECTIDGETYKNGFMHFFKHNDNFCVDINMESMKYQLFNGSLEQLVATVNEHIDFGQIKSITITG